MESFKAIFMLNLMLVGLLIFECLSQLVVSIQKFVTALV